MITRDQRRAQTAYNAVTGFSGELKEYKIQVHSLGANILRSGLAGALAFMQRSKSAAAEALARDLATAAVLKDFDLGADLSSMAKKVREMPLADYMLLTRELVVLVQWFRRAVQASDASGSGVTP